MLLLLLVGVVVVSGASAAWLFMSRPKAAQAAANTTDTVLFIHGFSGGKANGSYHSVDSGCNGGTNFGPAIAYFKSHGWTASHLKTVGFYGDDGGPTSNSGQIHGCDVVFNRVCRDGVTGAPSPCYDGSGHQNPTVEQHQSECDLYHTEHGPDGSNNQDIANLGCQLAWYIWKNYSNQGQDVRVVTHSMGGLLIRWALDRVEAHDAAFPPFLYIPEVVQIAAPNQPVGGADQICGNCYQGQQIVGSGSTTYGGKDFMDALNSEASVPTGSLAVATEWTVMSSLCDEVVDWQQAMKFPSSPGNAFGVEKVVYEEVHQADGSLWPHSCLYNLGTYNAYQHGDYLIDKLAGPTAPPAYAFACFDCASPSDSSSIISPGHAIVATFGYASPERAQKPCAMTRGPATGPYQWAGQNVAGESESFRVNGSGLVQVAHQTPSANNICQWSGWSQAAFQSVSFSGHPVFARDSNGQGLVFARATDNQLYLSQNGTPWTALPVRSGFYFTSDPAAGVLGSTTFVFAINQNGQVMRSYRTGSTGSFTLWSGMYRLSQTNSAINALSLGLGQNTDGSLELVAFGSDGATYRTTVNTGPNGVVPFTSLGTVGTGNIPPGKPAVASFPDGRLIVAARGYNPTYGKGVIYYKLQTTPGGSAWDPVWSIVPPRAGFSMDGPPAVARIAGSSHPFIFAANQNGQMMRTYNAAGAWTDWSGLYGLWPGRNITAQLTQSPDVMENAGGGLSVFVQGSDGCVYRDDVIGLSGAWSAPEWAQILPC